MLLANNEKVTTMQIMSKNKDIIPKFFKYSVSYRLNNSFNWWGEKTSYV